MMDRSAASRRVRTAGAALIALAAVAAAESPAGAASRDFLLEWRSTGPAVVTGTMTVDDAVLSNPGGNDSSFLPWVTALSVTVSGASAGNGTFTLADFSRVELDTNGVTLDLNRPLIGQVDGGLFDPAGAAGAGGEFNIFNANPAAPTGAYYGWIATNGGSGDNLPLTAIRPVRAYPFATEARTCQQAVGKAGGKYVAARHGALTGCYASLLAGKPLFEDRARTLPVTQTLHCPVELKTAGKIAKARLALRAAVSKKCTDGILSSLFACATTVDGLVDATGTGGCLVRSIDERLGRILDQEFGL